MRHAPPTLWHCPAPPPPAPTSPKQLSQLEGELSKVKATIKELQTEVTALSGERSQASGILQEIQGKLRVRRSARGLSACSHSSCGQPGLPCLGGLFLGRGCL